MFNSQESKVVALKVAPGAKKQEQRLFRLFPTAWAPFGCHFTKLVSGDALTLSGFDFRLLASDLEKRWVSVQFRSPWNLHSILIF
jgi:hypothetical protein